MPDRYGSKSAVHRRLQEWAENDVLLNLWRAFLDQLSERQKVRWDECFIDGMFIRAKKGARWSGRLKAAREQSLWYWPMARVLRSEYIWRRLPPSEVKLVEATLAAVKVKTGKRKRGKPKRLIGDKGYDSNQVRALLAKRGIEPIIPARSNN